MILNKIELVLVGGSAGCVEQFLRLFSFVKSVSIPPVLFMMHIDRNHNIQSTVALFKKSLGLDVKVATHGELLEKNTIYVAPPDYHTLLEHNKDAPDVSDDFASPKTSRKIYIRIFDDEPFEFCKPSIDLMFLSSTKLNNVKRTLAILLSGANSDGAKGINALYEVGAKVAVVDPKHSRVNTMQEAALKHTPSAEVIQLNNLAEWLVGEIC